MVVMQVEVTQGRQLGSLCERKRICQKLRVKVGSRAKE